MKNWLWLWASSSHPSRTPPFLTSLSLVRCGTQPSQRQDPVFFQVCNWAGAARQALLHPQSCPGKVAAARRTAHCKPLSTAGWSCPTLQGEDVEENPGKECLDSRKNAPQKVPLRIEVSVKRAGRPGPRLVGRRVQSQSWEGPGA